MTTIPDLTERDRRLARIRAAMAEENLDGLFVAGKGHWWTGRGYFRYLTDFHIWGHDGLIFIPRQEEPFLAFSSYAVAERIAARGWITDVRGDVYIAPRMAAECVARGYGKARIGVAGHQFILGAGTMELLASEMPDAEFVIADDLLNRVRAVKSELEMCQESELWDLAKSAMERFVEVLQPGATQRELAAEASRVALAGGARDILVFVGERPGEHEPPRTLQVVAGPSHPVPYLRGELPLVDQQREGASAEGQGTVGGVAPGVDILVQQEFPIGHATCGGGLPASARTLDQQGRHQSQAPCDLVVHDPRPVVESIGQNAHRDLRGNGDGYGLRPLYLNACSMIV